MTATRSFANPVAPAACLALLVAGCGDSAPVEQAAVERGPPVASVAATQAAAEPLPDTARVRIETELGSIMVAVDARRAPITAANFVRYAEEGRFDGASFYRAAVTKGTPKGKGARGFIQGGIRRNYRRMLPPIVHEPTSATGLRHEAGTISMARAQGGAGAMGDFFITTDVMPSMDAKGDEPGFAAFGKVVEGMDVVRRILAAPTVPNAGRGAMRGQMIAQPVGIVSAKRVE